MSLYHHKQGLQPSPTSSIKTPDGIVVVKGGVKPPTICYCHHPSHRALRKKCIKIKIKKLKTYLHLYEKSKSKSRVKCLIIDIIVSLINPKLNACL